MENFIEGIIMKIEIDLPEEIYKKLKYLCKIQDEKIKNKIVSIIKENINSVEIENF